MSVPDAVVTIIEIGMLLSFFSLPSLLARRGTGTRWTWFGAGIGFLVLGLFFALRKLLRGGPGPGGFGPFCCPVGFFDGIEELLLLCAVTFALAGVFYRPKKQTSTSLLGKLEGRSSDARRTNGKDQGD
jgi:hypothetical protein